MIGRAFKWRNWQIILYPWPFTIHRLLEDDTDNNYDLGVHLWWACRRNTFTPTSPVFRWWWFGPICVRRFLSWEESRAIMEQEGGSDVDDATSADQP